MAPFAPFAGGFAKGARHPSPPENKLYFFVNKTLSWWFFFFFFFFFFLFFFFVGFFPRRTNPNLLLFVLGPAAFSPVGPPLPTFFFANVLAFRF